MPALNRTRVLNTKRPLTQAVILEERSDEGSAVVLLRCGFRDAEDRAALPDKIFKNCQNCPRLYKCDEVAMAKGQVPKISILGPRIEAEQLDRLTT